MAGRVLTLTLNPTLDLATEVDHVVAGPKLRCAAPLMDPGGGGLNVARAIRILGGRSTAFVVAGGPTGDQVARLLKAEGIRAVVLPGPGVTRESLTVRERATGREFRFVLPGPDWHRADARAALSAVVAAAGPGDRVVLSGSQPPGVADDFPLILARRLAAKGAGLVLDTSGPALWRAVAGPARLAILRMDDDEAEELAGRALPTPADSGAFAAGLVARGVAQMVIAARGADGSVLATADGLWHAAPPPVPVVSKVGAGDTFTGAFVLALARGARPERALSLAVAAAASAVGTVATRLCEREAVRALVGRCGARALRL